MLNKILSLFGLFRELDIDDIAALKEFIRVLRTHGLAIATSIKTITKNFNELADELKD